MKLIVASAGISNKSLERELHRLVGKRRIKIAFIPTAANIEPGPKMWVIRLLNMCERLGETDIVDISALDKKIWLPRLKWANVIVGCGGDPDHLMKWIIKSGLKKELPKLLKTRVYVGASAGSMVLLPEFFGTKGLGYVNFHIRPHMNNPFFPTSTAERIGKTAKRLKGDTYALDDNSAVIWEDGKIHVVSEGHWKKFSGKN